MWSSILPTLDDIKLRGIPKCDQKRWPTQEDRLWGAALIWGSKLPSGNELREHNTRMVQRCLRWMQMTRLSLLRLSDIGSLIWAEHCTVREVCGNIPSHTCVAIAWCNAAWLGATTRTKSHARHWDVIGIPPKLLCLVRDDHVLKHKINTSPKTPASSFTLVKPPWKRAMIDMAGECLQPRKSTPVLFAYGRVPGMKVWASRSW